MVETKSINQDNRRVDKKVVVVNDDKRKQISSILMGHNKNGIVLGDGTYVNVDEIEAALEESLRSQETGTYIVSKKGNVTSIKELVEIIVQAAINRSGAIDIKGQNPKVTNQDARNWDVISTDGRRVPKGVAFLGNGVIQLPNGLYVSLDEIQIALKEYMFAHKIKVSSTKIKSIAPTPTKEKEIMVGIVRKKKSKAYLGLLPLILLLASCKINATPAMKDMNYEVITEEIVDPGGLDISIEKQTIIDILNNINMGDKLEVKDGQEFHTNSLHTNTSKTMGKEFDKEGKKAGQYKISGIAIIKDGKLISYIEDFYGKDNTTNLGEYVLKVITEKGLSPEEIEIQFCLGTYPDRTALGWISAEELLGTENLIKIVTTYKEPIIDTKNITGLIENFTGDTITLEDGSTIVIVDKDGNLLKKGDKVTSSTGQEYTIETLEYVNEQEGKRTLAFDLTPFILLVPLAYAKEYKKRGEIHKFEDEESYKEFIKSFYESKRLYENESGFFSSLRKTFSREERIIANLPEDKIAEVYDAIMRHAQAGDFELGPSDKIFFEGGKVKKYNSKKQITEDISEIVMKDIIKIIESSYERNGTRLHPKNEKR